MEKTELAGLLLRAASFCDDLSSLSDRERVELTEELREAAEELVGA